MGAWAFSKIEPVCAATDRGGVALSDGRLLIGWSLPTDGYLNTVIATGPSPRIVCGTFLGYPLYWMHNMVRLPLWVPILLIGVPVGSRFWRERRSLPANHCRQC